MFVVEHPYFIGVQYHPEYISRPMKPSPPYLGLLLASCGKLQAYANRGFRPSPRMSFCEDDYDTDEDLEDSASQLTVDKPASSSWESAM